RRAASSCAGPTGNGPRTRSGPRRSPRTRAHEPPRRRRIAPTGGRTRTRTSPRRPGRTAAVAGQDRHERLASVRAHELADQEIGLAVAVAVAHTQREGMRVVPKLTAGAKLRLSRWRSSSDSRDNRLPAGRGRGLTDGLVVRRVPLPPS